MANLFIIGNGFDLSHGLLTSYQHFRTYLIDEYPDASPENVFMAPWSSTMPDGGEQYDMDEVVSTIIKLIDDVEGGNWSNLEQSIGQLEFCDFFENVDFSDDNVNEWHSVYNNEDIARNLSGAVIMITQFFDSWVKTIDVNCAKAKADFRQLINLDGDFFLTFNYTQTLEKIYNTQNVCHIHGEQGERLYFGHGNEQNDFDDYLGSYIGSEFAMGNLHRTLQKNTKEAFDYHIAFFNNLKDIEKIYSYGFSFSGVDLFYVAELCKKINTSRNIWMLNDYDCESLRESYKKKIIACGFQGSFKVYHIT